MSICIIRAWDDRQDQHILDIKGKQSFPTTFELADVLDLKNSKSAFNKSIDLPATPRNVAYFGAYWDVNEQTSLFNPKTKKRAILEYDTVKVIDGFIQLVDTRVEDGVIQEYNVRIFSEESQLFKGAAKKLLRDLWDGVATPFDHDFTLANVATGFTGLLSGEVYYGIQDYGDALTADSIYVANPAQKRLYYKFKPYLKLMTIFDQIMDDAEFTYTSTFLSSAYAQSLFILAHSGDPFITHDTSGLYLFKAGLSIDLTLNTGSAYTPLEFEDESSLDFQDPNDVHDFDQGFGGLGSAFLIPSPTIYPQKFWRLRASLKFLAGAASIYQVRMWRRPDGGTDEGFSTTFTVITSITEDVIWARDDFIPWQEGYYYLRVNHFLGSAVTIEAGADTYFECYESPQLDPGQIPSSITMPFDYALNVPQETKQSEILEFFDTRFNLVWIRDKTKKNHFLIEPYNDYVGQGTEKDWSEKLDVSKTYVVKPMSSLEKKEIKFTTKEGDDIINQAVLKQADRIYGRQEFLNDVNDYATGTKKVESPDVVTPLNALSATEIMIPRLYVDSDLVPRTPAEGALRVFVKGGGYDSTDAVSGTPKVFQIRDIFNNLSSSITLYTHFGHYGEPIPELDNNDLNFGKEVPLHASVITPTDTAYKRFWETYLNQIYGADSRVLVGYFNITVDDIEQFLWSDKIYVLNAYWTINKLEFDPMADGSSRVELYRYSAALNTMKSLEASDSPSSYVAGTAVAKKLIGEQRPTNYKQVSTDYTITSSDRFIEVIGKNIVITLPPVSSETISHQYEIINSSGSPMRVEPTSASELINGKASRKIVDSEVLKVVNNATEWKII